MLQIVILCGYIIALVWRLASEALETPVSFWKLIHPSCSKRRRTQGENGISAEGRAERVMPDFSLNPAKRVPHLSSPRRQ